MPPVTYGLPVYDPGCRRCPRLATFLDRVAERHPGYFCRPVPPFGDPEARLLVVGLAPGMHGANRTGRPFTGDYAGILFYQTLFEFGFASAAQSVSADDGLRLVGARITNAVKCLPPDNKPLPAEVGNCNAWLVAELATLARPHAVLALGRVAHDAALRALGAKRSAHAFAHRARHVLPGDIVLFDSYHCSRYNTNTGRLTGAMFRAVFEDIAAHLRETGDGR